MFLWLIYMVKEQANPQTPQAPLPQPATFICRSAWSPTSCWFKPGSSKLSPWSARDGGERETVIKCSSCLMRASAAVARALPGSTTWGNVCLQDKRWGGWWDSCHPGVIGGRIKWDTYLFSTSISLKWFHNVPLPPVLIFICFNLSFHFILLKFPFTTW